MERNNRDNDIVLLFDSYSRESQDLYDSFKAAGIGCDVVVINGNGFLPEDVVDVYEAFLGDFSKCDKCQGRPLYFNQVQVPDYLEISGNNNEGKVSDYSKVKARIYYAEPKHKRRVSIVDWLDENGKVRCCEHYNKYGAMYARTVMNKDGYMVTRSYFDIDGREIIVENFVTGTIIVNDGEIIKFFNNKTEFVAYYLRKTDLYKKRIFFNSLSTPFFVSNTLGATANGKQDILFWQENTGNEIPGNMMIIFDDHAPRCERVVVQKHESYEKLISLGAPVDVTRELGYIFPFKRENYGAPEVLICTNTEDVEKLAELLEALPEVKFHVAALTEMSAKLMSHEKYSNARMYPNVRPGMLEMLYAKCDFYLDINHANEIVDALRQAFINNQIILGFEETKHNAMYTLSENLFEIADYEKMIAKIKALISSEPDRREVLKKQQKYALTATVEDYKF